MPMKILVMGLVNKFIDVEEQSIKKSKRPMDQLNLAMKTKYNPFKTPIRLKKKTPFNDPDLFLVTFQRVCE